MLQKRKSIKCMTVPTVVGNVKFCVFLKLKRKKKISDTNMQRVSIDSFKCAVMFFRRQRSKLSFGTK